MHSAKSICMKRTIPISLFALCLFLLPRCKEPSATTISQAADEHNSRNSLDWDGIYLGVLPCADCPGIQTTIHLNRNGTYTFKRKYFSKNDSTYAHTGTFTWNEAGNTIALAAGDRDTVYYFVGENTLIPVDEKGSRNSGPDGDFILTKSNYNILEKYWKLVELNGKPVIPDSSFAREPHIILKEADNRVNGNGGCNTISGYYEVRGRNRIAFSKMITTQMACANAQLERQFLDALQKADHFIIMGDTLILNRARMAPLARFKTVYMQ